MATVRTRKRGKTWSYAFEAGRTDDGRRKVVERGGFPSRDEAYEAGAKAFTDWKHGNIGITNERVTLKVFLENWLTNVCTTNVKPSTLLSYKSQLRTHVIPTLGSLPLADLTPARLDTWMRGLAKEGLSRGTLRLNLTILGTALSYAVYPAELLSNNPTHYIKIPKSAPAKVIERKIIPREQALALFRHFLSSSPCTSLVILLLYHTGMRISEVLGLTWECIDLPGRVIHVRHQLIGTHRPLRFAPPKSSAGLRDIPIDDTLAIYLYAGKKRQRVVHAKVGSTLANFVTPHGQVTTCSAKNQPDDTTELRLICTHDNGRPYLYDSFRLFIKKFNLNAHSFRHTHATLLYENGASAKSLAARLGHSSPTITEELYTHSTEKMQQDVLKIFEKTLQTSTTCRQNADKQ